MTCDSWHAAISPKVRGSWNLHALLPKEMDFFVLLSSAHGIFGSRGVSNYAAGNTYLDGLACYRKSLGLKTISLNLGAMVDDGMLADNMELKQAVLAPGHAAEVTREEFYALLDHYCDSSKDVDVQRESQLVYGISSPDVMRARGMHLGHQMRLPFYQQIFRNHDNQEVANTTSDKSNDTDRKSFMEASSLVEASLNVCHAIINRIANNFPNLVENPDLEKPLHSYGVDSLVAIELRTWFATEFGADIAIFEMLAETSLIALSESVARKSLFRQESWIE